LGKSLLWELLGAEEEVGTNAEGEQKLPEMASSWASLPTEGSDVIGAVG